MRSNVKNKCTRIHFSQQATTCILRIHFPFHADFQAKGMPFFIAPAGGFTRWHIFEELVKKKRSMQTTEGKSGNDNI